MHTLVTYMRPYWRVMLIVLLTILVVTATGLLGPWLIRAIVGLIADGASGNADSLLWISAGLAAVYIVRSLGAAGVFHYSHVVAFRVCRDLRDAVHARLQTFSPAYFSARQSGDIVTRVVKDTLTLEPLIADAVYGFVTSLLLALGIMGVLVYLSPTLTVLALAPLPAAAFVLWRLGRHVQPAFDRESDQEGELSAMVQDQVGGMRDIQLYNRETTEARRFVGLSDRLARSQIRARQIMSGFDPVVEAAIGLSTGLVVLVGGRMALRGDLPVEDLVAFILYIVTLYQPLYSVVDAAESVQRGLAALRRINEVLDHQPEVDDPPHGVSLPRARGDICIEGVDFAFRSDQPVLSGITLSVPAGGSLALVGHTGAGKSTLAALIARFYDVSAGRITLDGHDLRDIRLTDLRRNIAMVQQDVFLFNASVRDNIRFGRPEASDAEVARAARAAHADEFIETLPEGYDTMIGERGVRLSGGQKQRLSIARAILKDAPILILDEATSAVDPKTESVIQAALGELMHGRTTIIIAHRLSTIKEADKIAVLKQGRLAEVGDYAALSSATTEFVRLAAV